MYVLAPFIGWFISGCLKFSINFFRYGSEAKNRIGNGGFPSTHTTIITTPVMLIGFKEGFTSSIFGLGCAVAVIVIIDAVGLRKAIGRHAVSLNSMNSSLKLRESMGHNKFEVLGGLVLGTCIALLMLKL